MEVGPNRDQENMIEHVEELNNVNPELVARVLGFNALEYYVPQDPMDDLQCDSCQ